MAATLVEATTVSRSKARRCTADGISVIIPVYNSEHSLPVLIPVVHGALIQLADKYEVILVNDGSADGSWKVIEQLCAEYHFVVGVNLMRNYGQHNALLCGIRSARYGVSVTLDDDLQNPPSEIAKLIDKLDEGFDVCYGTPEREQHGLWRDLASQITKLVLQNAMGAEIARKTSAFKAFKTDLRGAFADYDNPFVSVDVLLTWGTNKFAALKVKHEARTIGKSNYNFKRLLTHAMNMLTGFSILPLQFASFNGFLCVLFGIVELTYVVGKYLLKGGEVAGFSFLASIITIFAGAQLLSLGIIGEYLARIHVRTMDRPPYVVRNRLSREDATD